MKWWQRSRVGTKLISGFVCVAVIGALIGGFGIQALAKINQMTHDMYFHETLGLRYAAEAKAQQINTGRALRNAFLATTEQEREAVFLSINHSLIELKSVLMQAQDAFVTAEAREYLDQTYAAALEYEQQVLALLELLKMESADQGYRLAGLIEQHLRGASLNLELLLGTLIQRQDEHAAEYNEEVTTIYHRMIGWFSGLIAVGFILSLGMGWWLTRYITRQLGGEPAQVVQLANAIAEGELAIRYVSADAQPGSIAYAMQHMQKALSNLVLAVRHSSDTIAAGALQLAHGNQDLSQRTEEQAASVAQTATAMEEMASTVANNAQAAQQVVQLAEQAMESATRSNQVVGQLIQSMTQTSESAHKITDITDVIDHLAFQTNILALNAAVEAARAGEAGRGFAVVASEVSALAQKSAASARDIKVLIDESVEQVEQGSRMAGDAAKEMEGIVMQVEEVTTLINSISRATLEQHTGIEQINAAMLQLRAATEQNTQLVEQAAGATSMLSDEAHQLVEMVSVFHIEQEEPADELA